MKETNIDRAVFRFAGVVVLVSVALGYFVHPGFLLLTAFAGVNMLQASFTGFCPLVVIFKKIGIKSGAAF